MPQELPDDRQTEEREKRSAKKASEAASAAAAKEKFQGFTAGGTVKVDPGEPKRSDFPEGLGGQASYSKALSEYRSKTRKQADTLGKALD